MNEQNNNLDTPERIKDLQNVGFSENQAQAIVKTLVSHSIYDLYQITFNKDIVRTEERLEVLINLQSKLINSKIDSAIEKIGIKLDSSVNNVKLQLKPSNEKIHNKIKFLEKRISFKVYKVKSDVLKLFLPFILLVMIIVIAILVKLI